MFVGASRSDAPGVIKAGFMKEGLAMLDTIFAISTLVFFSLSLLYVKFCDGLR
jgi:hypothetical protein